MNFDAYSVSSISRRGLLLGMGATTAVAALSACGANERSAR
ncbi:MAG: twin-arginine translocation signal domain-containing protein, partial [Cutibacterium granulosum]|nr:twin-arginine translocation signal domain-containing protein [Cutibacterium granulosum]